MGKAELQRLTDRTAVIRGPVNIGLICDPGSPAILVDSGNDDAAGKAILGICADLKSEVSLILNTHSHADHCGGNQRKPKPHSSKSPPSSLSFCGADLRCRP
jgi:glyoxylase-like metal-dependent hydrolase (beta-lactamase superfamily II)